VSIIDHMREHKLTAVQLAAQLGCTSEAVSSWRLGRRRPSRRMMMAIVRVTGGAVRARDFPPSRRKS